MAYRDGRDGCDAQGGRDAATAATPRRRDGCDDCDARDGCDARGGCDDCDGGSFVCAAPPPRRPMRLFAPASPARRRSQIARGRPSCPFGDPLRRASAKNSKEWVDSP